MVWNCPHCRAPLVVSEASLGAFSTWTLTRCPKCQGGALVQRAGKQTIKVDQLPQGEKNIVVPKLLTGPAQRSRANQKAAKTTWPSSPTKPVIRPAVKRAEIPKRPEFLKAAAMNEAATKMIPAEMLEIAVAPAAEPTTQIIPEAPTRHFEIPSLPMLMVVGHSIRGQKSLDFPPMLPDLPEAMEGKSWLSQSVSIVPTVIFITLCGVLGWNAIRFTERAPATSHTQIVDRLSQHAMAPIRRGETESQYPELGYNDDPTMIRARSADVPTYEGPGAQFKTVAAIGNNRSYPLIERNGSWVKLALDRTHSSWVNIAAVDLLP